jgi:hypothetical protein
MYIPSISERADAISASSAIGDRRERRGGWGGCGERQGRLLALARYMGRSVCYAVNVRGGCKKTNGARVEGVAGFGVEGWKTLLLLTRPTSQCPLSSACRLLVVCLSSEPAARVAQDARLVYEQNFQKFILASAGAWAWAFLSRRRPAHREQGTRAGVGLAKLLSTSLAGVWRVFGWLNTDDDTDDDDGTDDGC